MSEAISNVGRCPGHLTPFLRALLTHCAIDRVMMSLVGWSRSWIVAVRYVVGLYTVSHKSSTQNTRR